MRYKLIFLVIAAVMFVYGIITIASSGWILMIIGAAAAFIILRSARKNNDRMAELLELQEAVTGERHTKLVFPEKQLIKLAGQSAQRELEIMNDCVRILKETKNPETFFSRFDLLIEKAGHLKVYEKHLKFSVAPSAAYAEIWQDRQACIYQFLFRYFSDTFDQAQKLKTDKGKLNRYQKFYDSLQPYYYQLNDENKDYVETKYRAYTAALSE